MADDATQHADRMASAIEAALPRIQDMWSSFPYADMPGDDEAMTELHRAAREWRGFEMAQTAEGEG